MKKISGILTVSLVAVMAVGAARAELAATTYVDEAVTAATTNMEETTNKVTDTEGYNTDIASTSKYPSMAVANEIAKSAASSAVASKVNTNQGTTHANKVLTVNAQGVVTNNKIVDANIADGAAIATSKIAGLDSALNAKEASANKTDTYNATATDKATKFPTVSAAEAIADAKVAPIDTRVTTAEGNITTLQTNVTNLTNDLDTTINNKINTALGEGGAISEVLGDYATTEYVNTEVGKKQNTLSPAQLSAVDSGITAEKVKDYDGLDAKITTAQTQADKGVADAAAAKTAADAKLADVSTTSTGTNPIVKSVVKDGATVKVTAAALTEDELPAISQAKVTGLTAALDGKQAKGNYIQVPAADPSVKGTQVLTFDGTTYYWETIGRTSK